MSHSRSPSLNTRVSRFRDGYDYDESLASTEHFLRPRRDSSPPSKSPSPSSSSSQIRTSYFKEHTTSPALGTTLFSADHPMAPHSDIDLSRPETHYDPHSQRDTAALLPPSIHIEHPRGRSRSRDAEPHSDEERLLQQARKHADAHVDAYVQQQRRKEAAAHRGPPMQLSSSRGFYIARLVLRILSCAASVAIVGVLLDGLSTYGKTRGVKQAFRNGDGGGIMDVWPEVMEVRPTVLMVSVAGVAGLLSLGLSLGSVDERVRRMTKTGNVATIVISFVSLVLWVATTAYYASWDTKETHWDLMSWTCKHGKAEASYNHVNYGEICTEMRFAFWAAVGLAVLEFVNLVLFVVWYVRTRTARRYAKLDG